MKRGGDNFKTIMSDSDEPAAELSELFPAQRKQQVGLSLRLTVCGHLITTFDVLIVEVVVRMFRAKSFVNAISCGVTTGRRVS